MTSEIESRIESIKCTLRLLDANANGKQWSGRADKIRELIGQLDAQMVSLRVQLLEPEIPEVVESRWYKPWTWRWVRSYGAMRIRGEEVVPNEGDD